jgi:hypothetical protein
MADFHDAVLQQAQRMVAAAGSSSAKNYALLRFLAKSRSQLLFEQLKSWNGDLVRSGPFAGMQLSAPIAEGCLVPKLLGCYEAELHPVWEQAAQRRYHRLVDVGCAEGYYAVGLARLWPGLLVEAFDKNPLARQSCLRLAETNGVAGRLQVGGEISSRALQRFAGRRTLLVCDIEGSEVELLDPEAAPVLREMDLIVELHDLLRPGVSQQVTERFSGTHEIQIVPSHGRRDLTAWPELERLEPLDQMLAIWEFRAGPTPWAWMRAKAFPPVS